MKILSCNPGHDGAIALLVDGRLEFSIEAEKDSGLRYDKIDKQAIADTLDRIGETPDVVCTGGWWYNDTSLAGILPHVGYRGVESSGVATGRRDVFGRSVEYFSSSHERSHLLCAFGLSDLPKGTPCYALIWEGVIGSFYEIDAELNITSLGNVMSGPGNRFATVYGLADPDYPKDATMARNTYAGKLMALASFADRHVATVEEEKLLAFLLWTPEVRLDLYEGIEQIAYYNSGVDSQEFRNFASIASDRIFDRFHRFAEKNLRRGLPLLIAGGCGLNCDWNSKWRASGLFSDVFVPPVANDSGSAIGTAIDAQFHFTGDPKVEWSVYAGLPFRADTPFEREHYDIVDADPAMIADMLSHDLILGWVNGKYEIGPRALGNRSILAAPFSAATTERLNRIKRREHYRPIAPICLEADAALWFGCDGPSPHMLFTYKATTDALAAVTHVNRTARIQTVSEESNSPMFDLLTAFKARTGYGVLCNTSLNFNGKGFINSMADLDAYTAKHKMDGFVVDGRAYLRRESERCGAYTQASGAMSDLSGVV